MFGSLEVAPNTSIGGSPSSVKVPPVFVLFCFGSTLTFANGSVVVFRGSVFGATVVVVGAGVVVVGAEVVAVLNELAATVVEVDEVDEVELGDVVGVAVVEVLDDVVVDAALTVRVPVRYVIA